MYYIIECNYFANNPSYPESEQTMRWIHFEKPDSLTGSKWVYRKEDATHLTREIALKAKKHHSHYGDALYIVAIPEDVDIELKIKERKICLT